jgi:hypothetical protein
VEYYLKQLTWSTLCLALMVLIPSGYVLWLDWDESSVLRKLVTLLMMLLLAGSVASCVKAMVSRTEEGPAAFTVLALGLLALTCAAGGLLALE